MRKSRSKNKICNKDTRSKPQRKERDVKKYSNELAVGLDVNDNAGFINKNAHT